MRNELLGVRTPEAFNTGGARKLPGHLGILITEVTPQRVTGILMGVTSLFLESVG